MLSSPYVRAVQTAEIFRAGFADLAEDTASDVLRLPKLFRAAEMARAIHDAMTEEMLAS